LLGGGFDVDFLGLELLQYTRLGHIALDLHSGDGMITGDNRKMQAIRSVTLLWKGKSTVPGTCLNKEF